MDFQSAMETFAEAWVAANAGQQTQALALTRSKTPSLIAPTLLHLKKERSVTPPPTPPPPPPPPQPSSQQHIQQNLRESLSSEKNFSLSSITNQEEISSSPKQYNNNNNTIDNNQKSNNNNNNSNTNNENILRSPNQNRSPNCTNETLANSLSSRTQTPIQRSTDLQQQQLQQQQQQLQQHNLLQSHHHHQQQHHNFPTQHSIHVQQHQQLQQTNPFQSRNLSVTPKVSTPSTILENGLPNTVGHPVLLPSVANALNSDKILSSTVATPQAVAAAAAVASSIDRRDFDLSKVNAKSLPLHCIVESVPSLQASLTIDQRNLWKRRPNIETDSYVIIAASTPWSDIVTTALQRLGYSIDIASTARGSLIIKNWKPIPLESISDNPVVPVSDILGELTSVVTLRIVILRSKPSTFNEIKDKLLKLLVLQSHAVLRSTGCPLDEGMLSQICRSTYQNAFSYNGDIPDELRRKFDQWWSNQLSPHSPIPTPKMLPFMTAQSNDIDFPTPSHVAAAAAAAAVAAAGAANSTHSLHNNRDQLLAAAAVAESHHSSHHPGMMVHPALHSIHHSQYQNSTANQKTRMRTSFDPEMELPKLQRWFQENPHPSRQQIQSYVIQLNSLDSRRGRKPLDVNNVVYWFKNARAAQKRSEIRLHGIGNGYLKHDSHLGNANGNSNMSSSRPGSENMLIGSHANYLKNSPNMKFEDIDNLSQHSDDDDDIEEDDCTSSSRPNSPPQHLPLSLTMHERNRDSSSSNPPSHENITIKSELINGEVDEIENNNNSNNNNNNNNNNINNTNTNNNKNSTSISNENNNQINDNNNKRSNSSERISNVILEHNTNGDRNSERSSPNDLHDNNDRNISNSHINNNNNNNSIQNNVNNSNNNINSSINSNSNNNNNNNSNNDIEQRSTDSPKNSLKSEEDLDMEDDNDISQMDDGFRSPSPDPRRELAFPMVPNPMLSHSFMYMSHYMPGMAASHHQSVTGGHVSHSAAAAAAAAAGLGPLGLGGPNGSSMMGGGNGSNLNLSNLSNEERRKRNRTFIDPVTEVPKLEQWFALNTHPSHNQILKYTEDLNQMPYRQKFPRLESKNVQFWFKNRRAKCKRLKMSLYDSPQCSQLSQLSSLTGFGHNLKFDDRDGMAGHSMKYDDRDRME